MPKDTYDLFIGHEVGHALYTPYEGWHDSPKKIEGVPRSYMNVIEDARIERFVQNDYPGLVGPFKRGYMDLLDREFFGDIDDLDYERVKLIDKINLKAKLGDMIEVPFSPEEKSFFDRAFTTTTFDEVVQLCREILTYTQENQSELLEQPEDNAPDLDLPNGDQEMEDDPTSSGHDDYMPGEESNEEEENNAPSSEASDEGDEEEEGNTKSETPENSSDEEPTEESKDGEYSPEPEKDADTSTTDEIFRRAEKDLIEGNNERGAQPLYMREPNKQVRDTVIKPYKEVKAQREKAWDRWYNDDRMNGSEKRAKLKQEFDAYHKQVKKSANYAVKEFEMRKAAYQWSRAQTAKSGSLDVNKVWSYKTNEDIFARVTNLADAKNHGMMMFIDYSGSMSGTLHHVLDQLIHLVVFCKAVNIPFDVYAFTTNNRERDDLIGQRDGEIAMGDVSIPLLISSSLKKKDFEEALLGLYLKKIGNESRWDWDGDESVSEYAVTGRCEEFGSTPLNDALVLAHKMVKEFKGKHAVQKMNLIVLSDGDSNGLNAYRDYSMDNHAESRYSYYDTVLEIDGKQIRHDGGRGRELTKVLLGNIQKRYNCRTLGFFVSDSSHNWNNMLWRMDMGTPEDKKEANKEYRKFKCVSKENVLGYDNYYLVKGHGKLSTDSDEFSASSEDSIAKIRTSFKKFSSSKKNNKSILTNFGKAVA